jgi:SfnB family sulfur acquisition oxidoreductase
MTLMDNYRETELREPDAHVIRSDEEAVLIARDFADRLRPEAAERDLTRTLPSQEMREISQSGLLAITVPAAYGGADVSASTLAEVFRLLGSADPNVAQIPHSHFVYVQLIKSAGTPEQVEMFSQLLLRGARLANAQSERGGKTIKDISTVLTRTKYGYKLDGTKYYCTGSLFATWMPVLARLDDPESGDDGEEFIAFVPTDSPGLKIVDDWDALGQRLTASGTVVLVDVFVEPIWLMKRSLAFTGHEPYGAFAQLLHAAIDVGIARGALEDAAEFVSTKSRPWFEAEVERADEDPLVVQRFGEMYVDVVAAEGALREASLAVDAAFIAGTEESIGDASLAVAASKVLGERSSLAVSSALFEVAGTRSASVAENLSRHWRNARTHTLHDPVRWKLQHLGRFALRGERPPRHSTI